jgi:hypothetical protein
MLGATPLLAPAAGVLRFADATAVGHGGFAVIEREDALALVGPVAKQSRRLAGPVQRGDMLGMLERRPLVGCNSLPSLRAAWRMHFEVWSRQLPICAERGLLLSSRPDLLAYNPLLAIRQGLLDSPLPQDVVPLDLRPAPLNPAAFAPDNYLAG